jgi:protein-tyrosine phosphatase
VNPYRTPLLPPIDQRKAMIDIHSHILAGLDDGAQSFEESMQMARMAAAAGTTDIVASPHSNSEYHFEPQVVKAKIAELQSAVGTSLRIHYGCDFHLNPENIEAALREPAKYSINHGCYLLVEFSDFLVPKTTAAIFQAFLAAGIRPMITHPERNRLLRRRLPDLESWVQLGCSIQLTAQSWLGYFGDSAQKASEALLRRGLVHVIASDGHDLRRRPPVLQQAYENLRNRFGQEVAYGLCVRNPQAVLKSEPLNPITLPPSRPWYAFWRGINS